MRRQLLVATVFSLSAFSALAQEPTYEPEFGNSGIELGAMDTDVSRWFP